MGFQLKLKTSPFKNIEAVWFSESRATNCFNAVASRHRVATEIQSSHGRWSQGETAINSQKGGMQLHGLGLFFLAQWFCLWAYLESLVSAAGCLPSPTEWALPVSAGPSRRLYLLDFASSIWILSFSKLPKVPIYLQLPGIMLMHLISQMHSLFCSNVSAKQENITNSNSYKLLNCVPHSAPALWHEIPQTGCSQCWMTQELGIQTSISLCFYSTSFLPVFRAIWLFHPFCSLVENRKTMNLSISLLLRKGSGKRSNY